MITARSDAPRERRALAFAFVLSLIVHALLLPLILWLFGLNALITKQNMPRELIVASTAVRIERIPVPQPRSVPRAISSSRAPLVRNLPRHLHELARQAPTAPPQPARTRRAPTAAQQLDRQLAQEQVAFSHEIARLNAADNPKSVATIPPRPAARFKKSYFDESGNSNVFAGHGLLIPLKHWFAGNHSCYYVRYTFEYPNGASEDGNVPWPICYPRNADQMQGPPHPIDLPTPMPGFRVAAGTYLTPLLQYYYDRLQGRPPQGQGQ